jgi:hypothetical protein
LERAGLALSIAGSIAVALGFLAACSEGTPHVPRASAPDAGAPDARDAASDESREAEPDASPDADSGPDTETSTDAGTDAQDDESDASDGSDADANDGRSVNLGDLVKDGQAATSTKPRPAFGAIVAATDGSVSYVVESRRDAEQGPFNLPWRSRFRLAAYDRGAEVWAYAAEPDDVIGDVVVHPSGDLTLSLLRHPPENLAYQLVRLTRGGTVISTTTLPRPQTIPDRDYGPNDPRPLFRMKSEYADAAVGAWVRLLADNEGVVAAFLSFVDVPATDARHRRFALGLMTLDWQAATYAERWARVVEGVHAAEPAAWAYDELRQREQAIRPFLARDDSTGDLLVGRAWNNLRCQANVATFAEFTSNDCIFGSVGAGENELLPLAVTRFDENGVRRGTRVLAIDADAAEQVPFALAARDGKLATVGSVVRKLPDGTRRLYGGGLVDYDGYVIVYDAEGAPVRRRDFNLGRGDVLAAMRWTADGILAVGSAGFDRGLGGMSIFRGTDPLFVWLPADGAQSVTRVVPLSTGARHFNLHDVTLEGQTLVGFGFSDAPLTHSADNGDDAARSFGPLQIRLSLP